MLTKVIRLSMLSVLPILAICYLFPQQVLSIYSDSSELIQASVNSLYVVGLAALALCFGILAIVHGYAFFNQNLYARRTLLQILSKPYAQHYQDNRNDQRGHRCLRNRYAA